MCIRDRLLGDHQRHCLTLHVGAHQSTVTVIVLQEGDAGCLLYTSDRHAVSVQTIMQHLDAAEEVGTHGIHLVDVNHAGDFVLISLTPKDVYKRQR